MRISDWSSDVCSSDLRHHHGDQSLRHFRCPLVAFETGCTMREARLQGKILSFRHDRTPSALVAAPSSAHSSAMPMTRIAALLLALFLLAAARSAEHTSELQSLMRIPYAVFCLNNTNNLSK